MSSDAVILATRHWLERAVIGLNLCPFAKSVYVREQVRFVAGEAATREEAVGDLRAELVFLRDAEASIVDTTLLIQPRVFPDFLEFNDFLDVADALVAREGLRGVIQIASFHPGYQFAGSALEDLGNCTNRAPFPVLHLLRESSVARAVAAFGDTDEIVARNQVTLEALGHEGWKRLMEPPV